VGLVGAATAVEVAAAVAVVVEASVVVVQGVAALEAASWAAAVMARAVAE